jgi:hypothetical protein
MREPDTRSRPIPRTWPGWRVLAILGIWLSALGIASGSFVAGSVRVEEDLAFAGQFALTSLVSSVMVLAVGGEKRRSIEVLLSILALVAVFMASAYVLFWLIPFRSRIWLGIGLQQLWEIRQYLSNTFLMIAKPSSLIGLGLGIGVGGLAGSLICLSRRKPRIAILLMVGLLIAAGCSAPGLASTLAALVLESRGEGGKWLAASIADTELASTIGASTGSIVGAILAFGALKMFPNHDSKSGIAS